MTRPVRTLPITDAQRSGLRVLARRPTSTQREAGRAQIILHRADGLSQEETARRVGVNRPVVSLWENRFLQAGLVGLADAKGRGRKASIAPATQGEIISRATRPAPGQQRWSVRTMAQAMGVSKATVQRLWSANEIKPHLVRTFKRATRRNRRQQAALGGAGAGQSTAGRLPGASATGAYGPAAAAQQPRSAGSALEGASATPRCPRGAGLRQQTRSRADRHRLYSFVT